jgi:hypothetical protein
MIKPNPIKRSAALVQFSKDHHFSLLLVWKIRQGFRFNIESKRIGNYINFFFENYLGDHFKEEEELLFIHLDKNDNLRITAEKDHKVLLAINEKIKTNPEPSTIKEFADIIEQHIRFEERVLFAHLQHHLREAELSGIASRMNTLHPNQVEEDWKDAFWIRKKNR